MYSFRSISKGEYQRSYYHPLFKSGDWIVVKNMVRQQHQQQIKVNLTSATITASTSTALQTIRAPSIKSCPEQCPLQQLLVTHSPNDDNSVISNTYHNINNNYYNDHFDQAFSSLPMDIDCLEDHSINTVSYTHLTLPTNREV